MSITEQGGNSMLARFTTKAAVLILMGSWAVLEGVSVWNTYHKIDGNWGWAAMLLGNTVFTVLILLSIRAPKEEDAPKEDGDATE